MNALNRMAVVVFAKQPFLDWLRLVDPTNEDFTLDEVNREPSVYLLPECTYQDEFDRMVRRFRKRIFSNELDGWWRDRSDWPDTGSLSLFSAWFEYRWHSVVLDLVEQPLIREGM